MSDTLTWRNAALFAIAILVTVAVLAQSYANAQTPAPTFELPPPTGKLSIGTTRWVITDASRDELFATGKKRDIEVIAWYPAASPMGRPAPYLRDGMEEVLSFARLAKLGDAFNGLANIKTHATLDAPPAATAARFPVIVFQHGYTGLPSSHTAVMEDLASHGWAVLNVIHLYEATGAPGRIAAKLDGIPQYGTMIDTPMPAPFLMVYSGRTGRAGASDIIYRRSASKYRITQTVKVKQVQLSA